MRLQYIGIPMRKTTQTSLVLLKNYNETLLSNDNVVLGNKLECVITIARQRESYRQSLGVCTET